MYYSYHYVIDWDKVKTIDDLKRLIAAIPITFEPNSLYLELIQDLVKRQSKEQPLPMPKLPCVQRKS